MDLLFYIIYGTCIDVPLDFLITKKNKFKLLNQTRSGKFQDVRIINNQKRFLLVRTYIYIKRLKEKSLQLNKV